MIFKIGALGKEIGTIQTFLKEKDLYSGPIDGVFGERTKIAVVSYQKSVRLHADGVVGPLTWKSMFGKPVPNVKIPSPIYQSQLMALFGDPHESSFAHEWLDKTVVELHPAKRIEIYCHKLMIPMLQEAATLLRSRDLCGEWKTYDGCWCVRYMRGGNSLSVHSWGLAIDINAAKNPFGSDDFQMSEDFASCFEMVGFTWGGRWNYPDAMHFQVPKVR